MPYVYVGGKLLGGCDATKALIASGEFEKLLGGGGGVKGAGTDYAALQVRGRLRLWPSPVSRRAHPCLNRPYV